MGLSAVLITKDEEKSVADCLGSLGFADEIIVMDSESCDRTADIVKAFRAKFFTRPFTHFSEQKNFAVEKAAHEWVLSIDADERVTPVLREEILKVVNSCPEKDAYRFKRTPIIFGRRFRYAGAQKDFPVRLFRKGKAWFEGDIHETLKVEGKVGVLRGELLHQTFQTAHEHMRRLNFYTSLETGRAKERAVTPREMAGRALFRFLDIFFLRQGFREGETGLRYAVLSAWYEIVKGAKRWEKRNAALG